MHRVTRAAILLLWAGCSDGGTSQETGTQVLSSTESAPARQVRIHYDAGAGNSISIRGDAAPLDWSSGLPTIWSSGNVWVWTLPAGVGAFQFKPLLNDAKWSVGANYKVPATGSVDVYPFFGPSKGSLWLHTGFYSSAFQNTRSVIVYLPPSYFENTAKSYPVLYVHDGQNLFQKSTASGGVEWGVDEAMDALIAAGWVREAIVVGIYSTSSRIAEYTPTSDPGYGGGMADAYLDFVQYSVMPFLNETYRTLAGPQHTFMMGASFGGLVSFYAGWTRSAVYGTVAAVSSSFWWNGEALTAQVEQFSGPKIPARFYLDIGGKEGSAIAQVVRMRNALQTLGYQNGEDLLYIYDPPGAHNEASWSQRLPSVLPFLLGGGQP